MNGLVEVVNITNIATHSQLALWFFFFSEIGFSKRASKAFQEKVVLIQKPIFLHHYNQILQSCQTLQQE
jgi:hypothetical protein